MGAKSQRKGRAFELELPRLFKEYRVEAYTHGIYDPLDATAIIDGEEWPIECKREAKCNGRAYKALNSGARMLVEKQDRKPPLVTMYLDDFLGVLVKPKIPVYDFEVRLCDTEPGDG